MFLHFQHPEAWPADSILPSLGWKWVFFLLLLSISHDSVWHISVWASFDSAVSHCCTPHFWDEWQPAVACSVLFYPVLSETVDCSFQAVQGEEESWEWSQRETSNNWRGDNMLVLRTESWYRNNPPKKKQASCYGMSSHADGGLLFCNLLKTDSNHIVYVQQWISFTNIEKQNNSFSQGCSPQPGV